MNNKIYTGLGIEMNDIMIEASENRAILLMTTSKSRLKSGVMLSHDSEKPNLERPE